MAWEVMRKSCASHAQNHMSDFGHFRELWATACVASGWQGKGGNKHLGGKGTGPEKGQAGRGMAQRRNRRERGPGRDGAEREGRNERQKYYS